MTHGAFLVLLLSGCGDPEPRGASEPPAAVAAEVPALPPPVPPEQRGAAAALAWDEPSALSLPDEAPLIQTVMTGDVTRRGLSLPVGARVSWEVTVPAAGVLRAEASGGATLVVSVSDGGATAIAARVEPTQGAWEDLRLDLSKWAGRPVTLTLASEARAGARVFLAEPALYSATRSPRRLLLVFIDTLRPDRMGLYGHDRDTTPRIDAWAEGAAVFTEARSVAPWTLPASRAALSGRQPESWDAGPALHELLAAEGWATAAFLGGNPYLTEAFDMSRGWGLFDHPIGVEGPDRVAAARAWLAARPDQDAAALVHVMDTHLPYNEEEPYLSLWAGEPPEGMPALLRTNILLAARDGGDTDVFRSYLLDRYDQNLRYLDDALGPLMTENDRALVALFSDHGEEFWEHGGFEHGHSLYDELLRVPLVLKGPGVTAGVVDTPVSLVDLAPTVAELLGVDASGMHGRSLVTPPEERPVTFGRPLYVEPMWGVVYGDRKWTTHLGSEVVVNRAADPGERSPLMGDARELDAARAAFAEGVGRDAPLVWRVEVGEDDTPSEADQAMVFHHPDGFARAWLGESPWKKAEMTLDHEGDEVRVLFAAGSRNTREIYLAPAGDPAALAGLTVRAEGAELRAEDAALVPAGQRVILLTGHALEREVTITYGVAPVPPESATSLDIPALDAELTEALEALGYTDRE